MKLYKIDSIQIYSIFILSVYNSINCIFMYFIHIIHSRETLDNEQIDSIIINSVYLQRKLVYIAH